MFILEKFEKTGSTDGKWVMYAQHESSDFLEAMISNKKKPELFRISECEHKVVKEKTTRCLVFRVYDNYAAGCIEGKLMDHNIKFVSKNCGDYILFNVMRSNWKWHHVIDLIISVHKVRYYFMRVNTDNTAACA